MAAERSHLWDKMTGRYRLEGKTKDGKPTVTLLNLANQQGTAYVEGKKLEGAAAAEALKGAYGAFINDMYWLAMPFFAPIPYEVDQFYAQRGMNQGRNITFDWYPVGTGPYMLTENDPNARMVLERNPNFRGEPYPMQGEPDDEAKGLLRDAGKTMPFIDRVVFSREKEGIPYWNKFLQGYYDRSGIASDNFDQAVQFGVEG